MSEYIDRNELLKNIHKNPAEPHNERCSQLLEAILNAPTADVVEVVRCKDCKHFTEEMIGDDLEGICKSVSGMINPVPDFYCSYGERREECKPKK